MSESKVILKLDAVARGTEVTMKKYQDGSMTFSSDNAEHYIYLYPDQVAVLKALIGHEAQP